MAANFPGSCLLLYLIFQVSVINSWRSSFHFLSLKSCVSKCYPKPHHLGAPEKQATKVDLSTYNRNIHATPIKRLALVYMWEICCTRCRYGMLRTCSRGKVSDCTSSSSQTSTLVLTSPKYKHRHVHRPIHLSQSIILLRRHALSRRCPTGLENPTRQAAL
jgi:hypothetical protein